MIKKFRKRPIIVEAVQYHRTEESFEEISKFTNNQVIRGRDNSIIIPTLEGEIEARPNDWIIKGIKGEFYPCRLDIFVATYEKITEEGDITCPHCKKEIQNKTRREERRRILSIIEKERAEGNIIDTKGINRVMRYLTDELTDGEE